jgi:hypothetical protein
MKHSMHIFSKDVLEKEKKEIESGNKKEHKSLCRKLIVPLFVSYVVRGERGVVQNNDLVEKRKKNKR